MALNAVRLAAGAAARVEGWVVDADYLGRTIQLFWKRVNQHLNKPQLTYTILWHCRRYLRTHPGAFALPECLRWVRRRPLPRPPAHTAVAMRRPVQLRARRGQQDQDARAPLRPDRRPSDERVRVLGNVRPHRPLPSASVCPARRPTPVGAPRAHSLLRPLSVPGGRDRSFTHGGIMRWLGKKTSALTNRAEAYAFCTRRDKSAAGTAAWQPMIFGNLGMALNWYLTQQILRLCPDYDTLQQTDRRAAAAVKEEAGRMLLVDAVPDQRFIDEVVGKYTVDLSKLTIKDAFALEQTRFSHLAVKARGLELVRTDTMGIWTVTGERPAPKGARRRRPGPPGSSQRCARMQKTSRWCR